MTKKLLGQWSVVSDTYTIGDDESEEYVSYDVSGTERGGHGDVAGICDR